MKHIAVFASGYGSNFIKIHENTLQGKINAKLVLFVSDQPKANAVSYAKQHHIPMFIFHRDDYKKRMEYETIILQYLREHQVDWIILAGYMQKIGSTLLTPYEGRIINIHPSLLPMFKGKDAIKQAWDANAKMTGVTIHYVDEHIDHGKIIAQASIEINHASLKQLEAEIHAIEHDLYTETIIKLLED